MVTQSDASQADRLAQPAPGRTIKSQYGPADLNYPPITPGERTVSATRVNPAAWGKARDRSMEEQAKIKVAAAQVESDQIVIDHQAVPLPTSDTQQTRLDLARLRVGRA